MMKRRIFAPVDIARRKAVKAALRGLHEGPFALPLHQIFRPLNVSEATYSRWLADERPDLPDVLELLSIVSVAKNPAPLDAMARNCGDGYRVTPEGPLPSPAWEDVHTLLLSNMQTAHEADLELARTLADKTVEPHEAVLLVPKLHAAIQAKGVALEIAERVLAQMAATQAEEPR